MTRIGIATLARPFTYQVTGILLALFVVGVPLDALRFQAAGGGVEGMTSSMNAMKPLDARANPEMGRNL